MAILKLLPLHGESRRVNVEIGLFGFGIRGGFSLLDSLVNGAFDILDNRLASVWAQETELGEELFVARDRVARLPVFDLLFGAIIAGVDLGVSIPTIRSEE